MGTNAVDRAMLTHIFSLPGNGKKKRRPAAEKKVKLFGREFIYHPRVSRRSWEGWFPDQQGVVLEAETVKELLADAAGEALCQYEERVLCGRRFANGYLVEWVREESSGEGERKSFSDAATFYWEMVEEAGKPQDNPIVQIQLYGVSERGGSLEALDGWWRAGKLEVAALGEAEPERRGTLNA